MSSGTGTKMKKPNRKKSWIFGVLCISVVLMLFVIFKIFGPNTGSFTQGDYLYIHTGATYEELKKTLQTDGFVNDIKSFDLIARRINYPSHIHPGKYKLQEGMSNYSILRLLRSGRQTPVKIVINKLRTKQEFISYVCKNLEADSLVMQQMFHDSVYLSQFGLDTNTVMCAVMPDTYDFYWNTNADKAFRKIEKKFAHFWTDERKQEAAAHGITPLQAIIIASIIEEETNKNDEKSNMASVYLNRYHKGIRLQADPTVKFAIGDFTIRRITGLQLKTTSLYNTYINPGIPPGPICTPSVASIEAVLQSPQTSYMYFCAKGDFSGYHNFASTYEQQMKNAREYQQALNAHNIH